MKAREGFAGPLPPITTYDDFEAVTSFPHMSEKYVEAANSLAALEKKNEIANADRENPDAVDKFIKEGRETRALLR